MVILKLQRNVKNDEGGRLGVGGASPHLRQQPGRVRSIPSHEKGPKYGEEPLFTLSRNLRANYRSQYLS